MNGIDLVRLKAEAQVTETYIARAVDHAESDPTQAFAAIEDARKHMHRMYTALYEAYLQTIRRAVRS